MLELSNKGLIDFYALSLMGGTTKREDETKIGFFGSGNKYALACFLRNGIEIEIWSGMNRITVERKKIDWRDQGLEVIVIDGKETGLTTSMGPDWEIWAAIRELVCNAIDEGGYTLSADCQEVFPEEGVTKIYLSGSEVDEVVQNWDRYFSFNREPLYEDVISNAENRFFEKLNKEGRGIVYRRGIRAVNKDGLNSFFDYDFTNLSINEARVFSSDWELKKLIANTLSSCKNMDVIPKIIHAMNHTHYIENDCCGYVERFSPEFEVYLKDRRLVSESMTKVLSNEEWSSCLVLNDEFYEILKEQFPDLLYLYEKNVAGAEVEPPEELGLLFERAIKNLNRIGIVSNCEIVFAKMKDDGVVACYREGKITISVKHPLSIKELEETLFEEFMHAQGYRDCTRSFERYLMAEVIALKKVMQKEGEE